MSYYPLVEYPDSSINNLISNAEFIFCDVDNTVCESCTIVEDVVAGLINYYTVSKNKHFVFISGTDFSELYKMVSSKLLSEHYILSNSGKDAYRVCLSQRDVLYEDHMTYEDIERIVQAIEQTKKEFGIASAEDQILNRGSQVTFSVLGRFADKDLKYSYDPGNSKRKALTSYLQRLLPEYSLKIGGTTSIDIHSSHFDKRCGVNKFRKELGSVKLSKSVFIGDQLMLGGNDYPVVGLMPCIKVANPLEFSKCFA